MARRTGSGVEIGLGGLFKGLGELIELVKKMEAEGKTEVRHTGEIHSKGAAKDLRGVYGFSVKLGLGGEPAIETFGNIRSGGEGPVVEEVREPLTDVLDEDGSLRILAELPGVESDNIRVELNDDILTVSANGKDRKYNKEILLPAPGKPESLRTSYRNGILEVTVVKSNSRS